MKTHRSILSSIALVACAACFTGAASAQVDPDIQLGSKIPVKPEKPDAVRDGVVRDRYVRCTYGPSKAKIDKLLHNSDPMTADLEAAGINQRKFFRTDTLRQCFETESDAVQSSISFTPTAFRYLMLEAAYRTNLPSLPVDDSSKKSLPRTYVSKGEQLAMAQSLGAFSDCIALQDAVGADRILRTPAGTKAEKEAAMALVPAISSCIVVGQELQLTPASIRMFAADGMWQRFVASTVIVE